MRKMLRASGSELPTKMMHHLQVAERDRSRCLDKVDLSVESMVEIRRAVTTIPKCVHRKPRGWRHRDSIGQSEDHNLYKATHSCISNDQQPFPHNHEKPHQHITQCLEEVKIRTLCLSPTSPVFVSICVRMCALRCKRFSPTPTAKNTGATSSSR